MAEKSINYLARDFDGIKEELIKFSQKYYPTLSTSFTDSSVGSWFIDLVSAVGDDLSYSIDRAYQENNVNTSHLRSSVLNVARLNGVKVPGPKASMVEVELSCKIGVSGNTPLWSDCPVVKRDTQVGNGSLVFELTEDVNFAEQFNSDGYSNRKYEPNRNANGAITSYTVSKSVMAIAGNSKVFKKVITSNELEPFMEVILPDKDVMCVDSIIFKATTGLTSNPKIFEYFIDEEQYRITGDFVNTYRFFETDSLADLYRYGTETDGKDCLSGSNDVYVDYTETWSASGDSENVSTRSTRVYKGKWKPLTQKFITEYTDNGYLKIIFGAGSYDKIPSGTTYAEYRMSNMVNNAMLGVLPQEGWTMYVLYTVNGGASTNIGVGAINSIMYLDIEFPLGTINSANVTKSMSVTNLSNAIAGKDAPSTEELKHLIKYNVGAQKRCVTLNDYKAMVAMMPPKYGSPFRYNAIEENNKVVLSFLGLNAAKKLDTSLPSLLVDNVKEYLKGYKNITDYVEIRSGKVYNLGFEIDVYIDKNYTTQFVIKSIIDTIKDYMDVENHVMGDNFFIGDLEKEINKIDGVIALIDLRVYNIWGGIYGSNGKFPLYYSSDSCGQKVVERLITTKDENAICDRIDIEALDAVLENDYDSMFEIKFPESDISIRAKLK